MPNLRYVTSTELPMVKRQLENSNQNLEWFFSNGITPGKDLAYEIVRENLVQLHLNNYMGTGLMITSDGWIITAAHTIRNELEEIHKLTESRKLAFASLRGNELSKLADKYFIQLKENDNKKHKKYVLDIQYYAIDPSHDLVLLKADVNDNGAPSVITLDIYNQKIHRGDFVKAFGFSNYEFMRSIGRVRQSKINIQINPDVSVYDLFNFDVYIEPGASGGPVLINDRLAGIICSSKYVPGAKHEIGHGKAVKIKHAQNLVNGYISYIRNNLRNEKMNVPLVIYSKI